MTYNESDHRRAADGKFTHKPHGEATDVDLSWTDPEPRPPVYATNLDAIEAIRTSIESGDTSADDYDLDAIFDETFTWDAQRQGFVALGSDEDFWDSVEANIKDTDDVDVVESGTLFGVERPVDYTTADIKYAKGKFGHATYQAFEDNPGDLDRFTQDANSGDVGLVSRDGNALIVSPPDEDGDISTTELRWNEEDGAWELQTEPDSWAPDQEAEAINAWRKGLERWR